MKGKRIKLVEKFYSIISIDSEITEQTKKNHNIFKYIFNWLKFFRKQNIIAYVCVARTRI